MKAKDVVKLPKPTVDGVRSIESVLQARRSVRDYGAGRLTLAQVSQLLWAAQGVTDEDGGRTAPSAGALYPLETYVVAGNVAGLPAGVYRYSPRRHLLSPVIEGDRRRELCSAAIDQTCVRDGAAVVVLAAVYERTTGKYGKRGRRYVHMDAGHAAENVCLQAVALGLGTVVIGAFEDDDVKTLLGLSPKEEPLYLIPVGPMRTDA